MIYGSQAGHAAGGSGPDAGRLHRSIVVALLSAVPYGVATGGMIVRPPRCSPGTCLLADVLCGIAQPLP